MCSIRMWAWRLASQRHSTGKKRKSLTAMEVKNDMYMIVVAVAGSTVHVGRLDVWINSLLT